MGATGNLSRRPSQTPEMAQLALLDLERRRARERNERTRAPATRRARGPLDQPSETLPFEDFDLTSRRDQAA